MVRRSLGYAAALLAALGCGSSEKSEKHGSGGTAPEGGQAGAGTAGILNGGGAGTAGSTSGFGGVAGGGRAANGGAQAGGSDAGRGGASANGGNGGTSAGIGGGGRGGASAGGGGTSGEGTSGEGGSGEGGSSVGGNGAAASGGLPACVPMDDPTAPWVNYERSDEPAPVPAGGPIKGGTYFLTQAVYYGGTPSTDFCILPLLQETLRFTAESDTEGIFYWTMLFMYEDGSGRNQYQQEQTYKAEGSSFAGVYTCWEPYEYAEAYTATDDQILFIRGPFDSPCDTGVTLVFTFERQP